MVNPYQNITVYRNKKNNILVRDVYYPIGRDPDYFFNIHLGVGLIMKNAIKKQRLVEVYGRQKELACDIYMQWKWKNDRYSVVKRAHRHFPIEGGFVDNHKEDVEKNYKIKFDVKNINSGSLYFDKAYNPSKKNKSTRIKSFVKERNISKLVHFTHTDNLSSILKIGLISRKLVERLPKKQNFRVNDSQRLDGQTDAISLSIEFPNYRMFYKYHQKDYDNWVVISLKPEVLWDFDCAFCHTNAASNACRSIDLEERKEEIALEKLFHDYDQIQRKVLNIPEYYPTDPQAEILVFEKIPIEYFSKIHFYDCGCMLKFVNLHPDAQSLFEINRSYFKARRDYSHWQKNYEIKNANNDVLVIDDDIPF